MSCWRQPKISGSMAIRPTSCTTQHCGGARSFMGRKRLPPTDPREWLNRARSSLAGAGRPVPDLYLEDLCFNTQQAAEKAIKAVFIHRGLPFPYTHDVKRLLQLLEAGGV